MMSGEQTIVSYTGGTPTVTGTVTLFDSTVAFPGGCFHLLRQQWLQFSINIASAAGGGTGTLFGQYSLDRGTTWRQFYTATTADGTAPAAAVASDEIFIGQFKDIRLQYTNAAEVPTIFEVQLALSPWKPTSKTAATDRLEPAVAALTS